VITAVRIVGAGGGKRLRTITMRIACRYVVICTIHEERARPSSRVVRLSLPAKLRAVMIAEPVTIV